MRTWLRFPGLCKAVCLPSERQDLGKLYPRRTEVSIILEKCTGVYPLDVSAAS